MSVKHIPDGYHSVTPYLSIKGAAEALDFYRRAFGATERIRLDTPDGKIGHAEIGIGDSCVMLADVCEEFDFRDPKTQGYTTVNFYIYVEDVDTAFAQALAAGATEVRPIADQFYGDRTGMLRDPFGHIWSLATHKEDLTPAQIEQRMKEAMNE